MDMQDLDAAIQQARRSVADHRVAEQKFRDSTATMTEDLDTVFETFAEALLFDPVDALRSIYTKDLSKILFAARSMDRMKIFDAADDVEVVLQSYEYFSGGYPNTASAILWNTLHKVSPVLGFDVEVTHNLTHRERNGRLFRTSMNILIVDVETAEQYHDIFLKVVDAVQMTLDTIEVMRVWAGVHGIIAEYRATGTGIELWLLYENSIALNGESEFYDSWDGNENPLVFLFSE